MLSKPPTEKIAHTVPVLRKAIGVLEAVAQGNGTVTTKGLASTLRISPTTCYRILQSFVAEGWLRAGANGTFELSFGLVPLLRPLLRHELLIETVREPLSQLARKTGLTAKLTVRQGDDAVTLHSANSPKGTAITSRVGSVVSLAIGSSGAVFLAALVEDEVTRVLEDAPAEVWRFQKREEVLRRVREARRQGCCFDHGSYQPHINTLSAPIHGPDRELTGVITLLGFPQDFDPAVRPALIRELKFTAGGCTQLIAGQITSAVA
jgi:DNA-binding IclR family transcriptional regulator